MKLKVIIGCFEFVQVLNENPLSAYEEMWSQFEGDTGKMMAIITSKYF